MQHNFFNITSFFVIVYMNLLFLESLVVRKNDFTVDLSMNFNRYTPLSGLQHPPQVSQ